MGGHGPNLGVDGNSCPCTLHGPYPILNIYTAAHEAAHWYIKHALPDMVKYGYLKVPEFQSHGKWTFNKDYRPCCFCKDNNTNSCSAEKFQKQAECDRAMEKKEILGAPKLALQDNDLFDFIYNSMAQDHMTPWKVGEDVIRNRSTVMRCNAHHYFIYTGQDKFLGLDRGGEPREKGRGLFQARNLNLYNLVKRIWPCNNTFMSRCKDAAYDYKLSLNQRLIVGKSLDKDDLSKIECDKEFDAPPEVLDEEIPEVSPIPSTDIANDLEPLTKKWLMENGRGGEVKTSMRGKCETVLKLGDWIEQLGWEGSTANWLGRDQNIWDVDEEKLQVSLANGNERAWWLRKCCATTAKFNNKLSKIKKK